MGSGWRATNRDHKGVKRPLLRQPGFSSAVLQNKLHGQLIGRR
ncbi:MAG: hypothetical protein M5U34_28070 [Chloroflexi bacterium]|nr:hypothetical protein [Chloroflexota bacterium]